jgi:hypothetical protein
MSVEEVERYSQKLELIETAGRCKRFKRTLEMSTAVWPVVNPDLKLTSAEMVSEIDGIQEALANEMEQRKFVFILPGKDQWFEQDALFGKNVGVAFPSASDDIRSAGNCIAVALNTAAVFHLMCVVEIGLRALAKHLKVKNVKTKVPIELGTWEEIIQALELKLKGLSSNARAHKRQRDLDFYNSLIVEFRSFKDFWRNKVMHSRAIYNEHQAKQVFDHVCAFMQRMAERICEADHQ